MATEQRPLAAVAVEARAAAQDVAPHQPTVAQPLTRKPPLPTILLSSADPPPKTAVALQPSYSPPAKDASIAPSTWSPQAPISTRQRSTDGRRFSPQPRTGTT